MIMIAQSTSEKQCGMLADQMHCYLDRNSFANKILRVAVWLDFYMLSRRNKQSCDRCKQRKRKCEGGIPCALCNAANAQCTMSVAPKKRGPKTVHDQDLSLGLFLEPGTPKDNPAFVYQHPIAPQIDTEVLQLYYQMNPKLTPSMFVNPTQHDADYSFGALLNTDSFQPNMDWNPSMEQSSSIDFMPQIDPEIVEIYKMMNPKLLSVSNTSLTHVPGELCIPEYPHITSEFLLHLVSLFFTFFHPYAPILQETDFLQKLLPFNTHTDILYCYLTVECMRFMRLVVKRPIKSFITFILFLNCKS